MGFSSISIGASSVAYRSSLPANSVSTTTVRAASNTATKQDSAASLSGQPGKTDAATIGFGDGTVSTASAALHTVKETVQAARTVVESLAEVRARINEASSQEASKASNATAGQNKSEAVTVQFGQGQANAVRRVQGFITALNQTAATVQARLNGETPPTRANATETQATFLVNGQSISATLAPNAPHINLLA